MPDMIAAPSRGVVGTQMIRSGRRSAGRRDPRTVTNIQTRTDAEKLATTAPFIVGPAKYEAEQYDLAIALFTRAIAESDWERDRVGSGYLYFLRGTAAYYSGKILDAIKDYDTALDGNPSLAQAYFNRALADYSKAIELKPDYAEAYNNRADTYYELERYDRAIADCTAALHLKTDYADAFYNRGRAYYQLAQYSRAIDDYSNANTLDPKDSKTLYNRAAAYFQLAESENKPQYYERALIDYTTILSNSPDEIEAYLERGETYYQLGRCAEASNDFKKALESSDNGVKERARDGLSKLAAQGSNSCGGRTTGD